MEVGSGEKVLEPARLPTKHRRKCLRVSALVASCGTVLLLGTMIVVFTVPGGIGLGSFRVSGFFSRPIQIDPPVFDWQARRLYSLPTVYNPNGPEIQVGPSLPWRYGGLFQIWTRLVYVQLRVELPWRGARIAPPLP